jgi:hypothetical protein
MRIELVRGKAATSYLESHVVLALDGEMVIRSRTKLTQLRQDMVEPSLRNMDRPNSPCAQGSRTQEEVEMMNRVPAQGVEAGEWSNPQRR